MVTSNVTFGQGDTTRINSGVLALFFQDLNATPEGAFRFPCHQG